MDLPLILDPNSTTTLHKQLTDGIKEAIATGRLAPGQPLPSTRELAQSLCVSRDTTVRSYEDLSSQGFIDIKTARGTFVSLNPPTTVSSVAEEADEPGHKFGSARLSEFARRLVGSFTALAASADRPELNYGAPPVEMLPTAIWRQLLGRRCAAADDQSFSYASEEVFGHRPLRQQISRFLNHTKGLACKADEVIVFPDAQSHLDLIARMTVDPGDLVVLESPGYTGARELFMSFGARVHTIPVDKDGMVVSQLNQLNERCKLLYVTPSHHDPTGAVMSLARRRQLLAWASENCDFIVEDAFDSDYFYGTTPPPSLMGLNPQTPIFYIYSFWKVLFPLVITGCLVVPRELMPIFQKAKLHLQRNFSLLEHQALTDLLSEGHLERHLHKTKAVYKKRRQELSFALKRTFQTAVVLPNESAGLHIAARFNLPLSVERLLDCARQAGLPMASTCGHYDSNPVPLEVLIDFASLDSDQTQAVVSEFFQAVQRTLPEGEPNGTG